MIVGAGAAAVTGGADITVERAPGDTACIESIRTHKSQSSRVALCRGSSRVPQSGREAGLAKPG